LQRFQTQLAELEIVLAVDLVGDAILDRDIAIDVAAVFFAVADVVDRRHGFDAEQLVFHEFVELLTAAGEHGASGHSEQALFEFAGG
jgi:hypothetical protein